MEVTLIDSMGTDLTVANAARVSFAKESDWEGGDWCEQCHDFHDYYLSEKDTKLIKYLANHNHFTPFTHCMITMREKVPIFVARQRFKHSVGFSYNEVSRRYVNDPPEFYFPEEWRGKPINAKQGSSDKVILALTDEEGLSIDINVEYKIFLDSAFKLYDEMIKNGVAPELARIVLPQSMYTEYFVSGSLAAWARAYKLRIDEHSQKEIQDVAVKWNEIIRPLFPVAWSALVD